MAISVSAPEPLLGAYPMNAGEEIADLLEENPSLKPFFHDIGEKIYQQARRKASVEAKEPPETFPATFGQTGWTWEQVLDFDFYPGPEEPQP